MAGVSPYKSEKDLIQKIQPLAEKLNYTFEVKEFKGYNSIILRRCRLCNHTWDSRYDMVIHSKKGCPKCAFKRRGESQALSVEVVIQRLRDVSNGRYTFEEPTSFYKNTQRINCTCNTCGHKWDASFMGLYRNKSGCPECGKWDSAKKRRSGINKIIEDTTKWANGRFSMDYSNTKLTHDAIVCTCNTCGHQWNSTYHAIKSGSGCFVCGHESIANKRRCDSNEIMSKLDSLAKSNKFEYRLLDLEYKHQHQRIWRKCLVCGHESECSISNLISNKYTGCKKCKSKENGEACRVPFDEMVKRLESVSDGRYSFKIDEYIGYKSRVRCICNKCGIEWGTSINPLLSAKTGCPKCTLGYSKSEKEIVEYLKSLDFMQGVEIIENDRSIVPSLKKEGRFLELDIYIPSIKVAIEFNGLYWHRDDMMKKRLRGLKIKTAEDYHSYKTEQCRLRGIDLLHIDEKDWLLDKNKVLLDILNFVKR